MPFRRVIVGGFAVTGWLCAACSVSEYASPKNAALSTFFEDGEPNYLAFNAALESKFAPGTSVAELVDFAKGLGGSCGFYNKEKLTFCQFSVEGKKYCAHQFMIEFDSEDEIIQKIESNANYAICD